MARKNKVKVPKRRKTKKKIKKNKQRIFLFILFFLVLIFSIFNLFNYFSIIEQKRIYTEVMVSDKFGIAINKSALLFGRLVPGTSSNKNISIVNDYDHEISVDISSKGDIKEFLSVSDNGFILKKGELKDIKFFVKVPKHTEYGNYSGEIIVDIKRTLF
jgi:zona occludens toxin (predicted ATPase)